MRTAPLGLLLIALAAGCGGCPPTTGDDAGQQGNGAGEIVLTATGDGFDVVLRSLERPLRTFQVGITLQGGAATAATAKGPVLHDLVEAGLDAGPRSTFTLVVGDTRRVPLDEGVIAHVTTSGSGSVTLADAKGVDETGALVTLVVGDDP